MPAAAQKTVRFARVVEQSGQPHAHTLWLPPEQDRDFKRAVDAQRVMTIERRDRGADVGRVGLDQAPAPGGQFLIFPKSLGRFAGARVIGIKFDLIEQPEVAPHPAPPRDRPRAKKQKRVSRPQRPPSAARSPHVKTIPIRSDRNDRPMENDSAAARSAEANKRIKKADTKPAHPASYAALARVVRAAMKDLQHGKSVAAYQRLEDALR